MKRVVTTYVEIYKKGDNRKPVITEVVDERNPEKIYEICKDINISKMRFYDMERYMDNERVLMANPVNYSSFIHFGNKLGLVIVRAKGESSPYWKRLSEYMEYLELDGVCISDDHRECMSLGDITYNEYMTLNEKDKHHFLYRFLYEKELMYNSYNSKR